MDFYILIIPRDTQYIVFGALLYAFLRLSLVSCIHCYRRKNKKQKNPRNPSKEFPNNRPRCVFCDKGYLQKIKTR